MIPAKEICEAYEIGGILNISKVEGGLLNDNYKLETTTGSYFVKSVRVAARERLAGTYAVENYMRGQGILAVVMLKTKSDVIAYSEGEMVYTLYPFIEGERGSLTSLEHNVARGKLLAEIHRAGEREEAKVIQVKQCKDPKKSECIERIQKYEERIRAKAKRNPMDEIFLGYIAIRLEALKHTQPIELANTTLIHGDYHAGNLLFRPSTNEIVGVCDWEKAEWAPRSYELARAILYMYIKHANDLEEALNHLKVFLQAYTSVYPISKQELADGLQFRFYRILCQTWLEEKHYDNNDTRADHLVEREGTLIKLLQDPAERDAILACL